MSASCLFGSQDRVGWPDGAGKAVRPLLCHCSMGGGQDLCGAALRGTAAKNHHFLKSYENISLAKLSARCKPLLSDRRWNSWVLNLNVSASTVYSVFCCSGTCNIKSPFLRDCPFLKRLPDPPLRSALVGTPPPASRFCVLLTAGSSCRRVPRCCSYYCCCSRGNRWQSSRHGAWVLGSARKSGRRLLRMQQPSLRTWVRCVARDLVS